MKIETHANDDIGPFEARYTTFLATIANLRPRLHRYCARMTGSSPDGEDVMQEALFEAFRKLDRFDDSRELSPWLFQIAHNRCIDSLRRRKVREKAEAATVEEDIVEPGEPPSLDFNKALERLVINLPPKERACVLLKDAFDYSLQDIAPLVGSTVGGVKAALSRGRSKLATLDDTPIAKRAMAPDVLALVRLYVERFNARDWEGVRELTSADARLHVADRFAGRFADSPYFINYERATNAWHLALGEVDGETLIITLRDSASGLAPSSIIRLLVGGGRIVGIVDYIHCPWVLECAYSVTVLHSN